MKIVCPKCRKTLNAPDSMAGRRVKCPGCGGALLLPTMADDPPASPLAAPEPVASGDLPEPSSEAADETENPPGRKRMLILAIILFVQGGLGALAPLVASIVLTQLPQEDVPRMGGREVFNAMLMAAVSMALGIFALHAKRWVNWATVTLAACFIGNCIVSAIAPRGHPTVAAPAAVMAIVAPVLIQGAIMAFAISNIKVMKTRLGAPAISSMLAVLAVFTASLFNSSREPAAPTSTGAGRASGTGLTLGSNRTATDYDRAPRAGPNEAPAIFKRASALSSKGDLNGAIADYSRVLELEPRNYAAYHNRAAARQLKGDLDGAVGDYTKALELAPKHALSYIGRGNARVANGDCDGAVADFDRALQLDPNNTAAREGRGTALAEKGDPDGAVAEYTKALDLNPEQPASLFFNRGMTYQDKGDLESAIADYDRAVKLCPQDAYFLCRRGSARLAKHDLIGAHADFRMTLTIDPDHAAAHNGIAWICATAADERLRNAKQGVDRALRAVTLTKTQPQPLFIRTLAAAQARAGQFDAAVKAAEEALRLLPARTTAKDRAEYEAMLNLFKEGKPYTDSPQARKEKT